MCARAHRFVVVVVVVVFCLFFLDTACTHSSQHHLVVVLQLLDQGSPVALLIVDSVVTMATDVTKQPLIFVVRTRYRLVVNAS